MPPKGYKMSQEARSQISRTLKDYFQKNPPIKHSDKTKALISSKNKGKKRTPEQRAHLSLIVKDRLKNPENHPQWKGGRKKHGAGYVQVKIPNHPRANKGGYVLEHIIIWEQANGQPVPPDHSVHHLNGIKDDNHPDNLVVIPKAEHIHRGLYYYKRIQELEKEIAELKALLNWPEKIQEWPCLTSK
jgi:hypothetical protein